MTRTELDRRRLAELYAEQDRMMAEASEPIASPPVSENDDERVIYKRYDNGALPPAPADGDEPSDGFSDGQINAIAEFTVEYVRQKLSARDERIAKLETQVEMLTALIKPKLWTP